MATDCGFVAALCKGVNETRRLGIDLVDLLAVGETLTDPPTVTASPTGPTISGQEASGTEVLATVAGGTGGVTYKIWFSCSTSSGQTIKKYLSLTVDSE